jgi:Fe-S-cluster containining protein
LNNETIENKTPRKVQYRFKCLKCGDCCRVPIKIIISVNDTIKWKELNKTDFLNHIQICPLTFSPLKLGEMDEGERTKVIEFIVSNHTYDGEGSGFTIHRPYLRRGWSSRPILHPNSFDVIIKGVKFGLEYIMSNDLGGQCPFLRENVCSIHEIKPLVCKNFPYTEKGKLRTEKRLLEICKGIQKLG